MPSWRPDTTKQRLRLGQNRYRCGCRDARTNAKRFAHSCIKRYSVWRYDANRNANAKRHHTAYCYPDCDSDGYGDGHDSR
jgi:hypothetical protein